MASYKPDENALIMAQVDWAFYSGVSDGVDGETIESANSDPTVYCSYPEKLTPRDLRYLWCIYLKGHIVGQSLSKLPTEALRGLLRDRVVCNVVILDPDLLERVINLENDDPPGSSSERTEEEKQREYLLEMLSTPTNIFQEDVDMILLSF